MKGRTSQTYNLKVARIKKWYNRVSNTTKKTLKPLEWYLEKVRKPNAEKKEYNRY